MHRDRSLSVVIPTLGDESLRATIMQINQGSLLPTEILVCIPEKEAPRAQNLGIPGVRVIVTDIRGQVAQRVRGFQEATGTLVLQMDDDIQLAAGCLEQLVEFLHVTGPGNAVGPIYMDSEAGKCVHHVQDGVRGWLQSLYASTVCGAPWGAARMGRVTSIGVNYGVDGVHCQGKPFVETDWLPGGCVLSFRNDLIREMFFPFPGKAYCEDIIHSLLRKRSGMRHWVVPGAQCSIDVLKNDFPDSAWRGAMAARRYYTRLNGGNTWRMGVYSVFLRLHWFLQNKRG